MSNQILILTDGDAEELTLDVLLKKLPIDKRYRVFKAEIQPYTKDNKKLYRALKSSYDRLFAKRQDTGRYEKVIMVIDFEKQAEAGECLINRKDFFVNVLQTVYQSFSCSVVFKVRKYENWIIGDPNTIKSLKGYNLSNNQINQVIGTADNVADAVAYLKQAKGRDFDKINDSQSIVPRLNIAEIEKHSRSFRKLVKEIGVVKYAGKTSKTYIP